LPHALLKDNSTNNEQMFAIDKYSFFWYNEVRCFSHELVNANQTILVEIVSDRKIILHLSKKVKGFLLQKCEQIVNKISRVFTIL